MTNYSKKIELANKFRITAITAENEECKKMWLEKALKLEHEAANLPLVAAND